MTPFEIRVLLHYFTTPSEPPEQNAPIFPATIQKFLEDGLIQRVQEVGPDGAKYETSNRGEAYCKALTELPLPVQKWVMPT